MGSSAGRYRGEIAVLEAIFLTLTVPETRATAYKQLRAFLLCANPSGLARAPKLFQAISHMVSHPESFSTQEIFTTMDLTLAIACSLDSDRAKVFRLSRMATFSSCKGPSDLALYENLKVAETRQGTYLRFLDLLGSGRFLGGFVGDMWDALKCIASLYSCFSNEQYSKVADIALEMPGLFSESDMGYIRASKEVRSRMVGPPMVVSDPAWSASEQLCRELVDQNLNQDAFHRLTAMLCKLRPLQVSESKLFDAACSVAFRSDLFSKDQFLLLTKSPLYRELLSKEEVKIVLSCRECSEARRERRGPVAVSMPPPMPMPMQAPPPLPMPMSMRMPMPMPMPIPPPLPRPMQGPPPPLPMPVSMRMQAQPPLPMLVSMPMPMPVQVQVPATDVRPKPPGDSIAALLRDPASHQHAYAKLLHMLRKSDSFAAHNCDIFNNIRCIACRPQHFSKKQITRMLYMAKASPIFTEKQKIQLGTLLQKTKGDNTCGSSKAQGERGFVRPVWVTSKSDNACGPAVVTTPEFTPELSRADDGWNYVKEYFPSEEHLREIHAVEPQLLGDTRGGISPCESHSDYDLDDGKVQKEADFRAEGTFSLHDDVHNQLGFWNVIATICSLCGGSSERADRTLPGPSSNAQRGRLC